MVQAGASLISSRSKVLYKARRQGIKSSPWIRPKRLFVLGNSAEEDFRTLTSIFIQLNSDPLRYPHCTFSNYLSKIELSATDGEEGGASVLFRNGVCADFLSCSMEL